MKSEPTDDLSDTVEQVRSREFTEVPAELIATIISVERDHIDGDRIAARRAIRRVIEGHTSNAEEGR